MTQVMPGTFRGTAGVLKLVAAREDVLSLDLDSEMAITQPCSVAA